MATFNYVDENGEVLEIEVNATDIKLLDINNKFKHKNLEDAMQEVGSGTEENMSRIEGKVDKLEEDKTNILNTIGQVNVETDGNVASQLKDCAKKDGTLQAGLNAEQLGGKRIDAYLQNFDINDKDFNTLVGSGVYRFNTGNAHKPSNCADYGQLLVMHGAGDTITQIVSDLGNQLFVRSGNPQEIGGGGTWSHWKQISTTDRTKVIATPAPNINIVRQNIYIENKTLYLDVTIQKSDSTEFEIATHKIFSIPATGINYNRTVVASHWSSDAVLANGFGSATILSNGDCYIINQEKNSKIIRISATFALEGV